MRQRPFRAAVLVCGLLLAGSASAADGDKRPLTVKEEISIAYFGDPNTGQTAPITLSPDGRYVAVHTTRGDLAENRMHDEVRVYDLERLKAWLAKKYRVPPPPPVTTVRLATCREGPIITDIRWLPDSRAIVFLAKTTNGLEQIWEAGITAGVRARALTPADRDVRGFDVRDLRHFVYAERTPSPVTKALRSKPATSANEEDLISLLASDTTNPQPVNRLEFWAADGGTPHRIIDRASGRPIISYTPWVRLAPDGRTAALELPPPVVPKGWEGSAYLGAGEFVGPVAAGPQDLSAPFGNYYVTAYDLVDLQSGTVRRIGQGPTAGSRGWDAPSLPVWSADGRVLLVPGAYPNASVKPCIAVVTANDDRVACVRSIPLNPYEEFIKRIDFEDGRADRVQIERCLPVNNVCSQGYTIIHYEEKAGRWENVGETPIARDSASSGVIGVKVTVKQGLNDPPVLWASFADGSAARPLWDPNPQLKSVELGQAKLVDWTGPSGDKWQGGLYLPHEYKPGTRYPLVIQTHGFAPNLFRPSGSWPEGFAARELSAAGIAVLQVPDCKDAYSGAPDEAACHETMYKAAIEQLAKDGIIDPAKVGITGFSRTCLYVLDLLTRRTFPVRAALATDGVNAGYFQYILTAQWPSFNKDAEKFIGAKPWGPGLGKWMAKSPEFNLDKVDTPLMLIAARPGFALLTMWEPYAILTAMHQPVDLLVLHTTAHPTWQPAARYASQQGAVEWFRFWLQGYEDSDSAKTEQYARWEKLCDLQRHQNPQDPSYCVPTAHTSPAPVSSSRAGISPKAPKSNLSSAFVP
jgi:hypothetical protein